MPSPTEQVSSETLTSSSLPLKEGMETTQENVPHVDPDDGDEVTNFDNDKVHEEQQQQQQQQQQPQPQPQSQQPQQQPQQPQQQPQQSQQQGSTATSATSTNVATFETTSSPSHMTDSAAANEVANATTTSVASTASPNDSNTSPTTTQDMTQDMAQDNTTQDMSKASPNSQKRKYNKRIKEEPTRRRTRNTSKSSIAAISTQDDEQMLANRKTSNVTTPRRPPTSTTNIDHIERQLPPKEGINQSNISDRFVDFIMYCNPLAPENLDKVALVRSFNAVPKSDGKIFQTWTLYQLVDKHYAGEIRTWTKLAQKLGVVRTPDASPQKIQQYAVRLKKWMASVHVDAYFDYLLSRPNDYYQLPQRNPTDASDDESDVVLKLIKRAGSKRQKRKYTRRNTNTSSTSANDDGTTNPEGVSRGDTTEIDDEAHFESEEVDEGADKHRGKRVRASYSDEGSEEEDDKDPWAEMDVDGDDEEPERPSESTGTNQANQRRKSVVQVGFCPNWVKDNAKEEESENVVGGRLGVRKEANPENDSSRYYRQYPSQFALIEPKNGSNIPTPNPSPTTSLPVMMSLSSGNITGSKRVLSHSGATGGAGTQLRWRISTGPVVKSSADESYLTTSPSSSQKDPSKKKQEPVQTFPPGQTVLDLRQPQPSMAPLPPITRPRNSANTNIPSDQQHQQQFTDGKNYAEMLLPSALPSNDKERIAILQKNLISAVGMLEDSQRKIKTLNDLVRQREDDVRQRVVRALKNEVNTVIEKFQ